ncbi:MAG: glucosaminidase domain-containing protein [Methanofastidiosum sp.]
MNRQEFINLLSQKIDNIPDFPVLKSLAIAQACLESAFGKKHFYNNLFGIKCHSLSAYAGCRLAKTKEFINGTYNDYRLAFQTYNSFDESLEDYARLMRIKRYKPVREAKDYLEAVEKIRTCGYATSPSYTKSLRKIIEKYKLYELDNEVSSMNKNEYLTKNFQYKEFFSGSIKYGLKSIEPPPEYLNRILDMAEELQIVRDYIGSPIIITSGYRTPDWNKRVGGVKNSYHTQGLAVDIRVNGMPPYDLAIYVAKLTVFRGFGVNLKKNFVHCDYREKFEVFRY